MSRRSTRYVRLLVAPVVCLSLLQLHELPVAAAPPAQLGESKPEKSKPLGKGEAKVRKPEKPSGDFDNPPAMEGLAQDPNKPQVDHFDPKKSKLVEQTETADIYDNGDGTRSAKVFYGDVNFKDATGNWAKIDSSLALKNGKIRNAAGPVSVEIEESPTAAKAARISNGKNALSIGVDGLKAGKKAKLSRDTKGAPKDVVTFTGAVGSSAAPAPNAVNAQATTTSGDADIQYTVIGSRLKESLILHEAPTSAPVFRFPLTFEGLHAATRNDGTIVFLDDNNSEVMSVDRGQMWDSSPNGQEVDYQQGVKTTLSSDGQAIEVTPDFAWMTDPARQYPITIDPTYSGFGYVSAGYMDTFANSSQPNTNFTAFYQYGAYANQVGYSTFPSSENYTYFYQDINFLNGKQILDARWRARIFGHSSTKAMRLYPVAPSSWNAASLTWNNKPGHRAEYISNLPPPDSWTDLPVTDWVKNWTNGTWQNSGISIDTAGQNGFFRIASTENTPEFRPYIFITYNTVPGPAQLTAPDPGAEVMTDSPTLSINPVSDPDGDQMKYWFRVSDTSNPEVGQVINSGWQTSTNWQIPSGSLIDGVSYAWYVIAWDGNTPLQWNGSLWRSFKVNLHVGQNQADPTDEYGPVSVNLVSGNVSTSVSSPTVKTVGGDMGLNYTYNSKVQSRAGLTGRYYDGCGNDGTFPLNPYIVRQDPQLDLNWSTGSPGPSIGADNFCAEWDGYIAAPDAGYYCFDAMSDDGLRVWVNNQIVIDRYSDGGASTGTASPCLNLYKTPSSIHAEFYDNTGGAAVQLKVQGVSTGGYIPVPSSWFSTTPSALPQGWQLSIGTDTNQAFTKAIIGNSSVVIVDSFGMTREFKVVSGSGTDTIFKPPAGTVDVLRIVNDGGYLKYQLRSSDAQIYLFNAAGALESITSPTDDLSPASSQFVYEPGPDSARLKTIKDPVSGKEIQLAYSVGLNGAGPCANAPSGFSPQGPAGMLCKVSYPDGTTTDLYYSAADVTGQLMRVTDPGTSITDFSYQSGLLNGVADPAQMDYRANHSVSGVHTRINYNGDKASSVVLASPDGSDPTDFPPTTNRPWHSYVYATPFAPTAGGETRINMSGLTPPQGFARRVTFNGQGQLVGDTDAKGIATTKTWDAAKDVERLLSEKNEATGLLTTTIWDASRNLPTDIYGPAPSACFGTNLLPNGTCTSPVVPHSQNEYDGGIDGLAVTWWSNNALAGTPAAHSTTISSSSGNGTFNQSWSTSGPAVLNGQLDDFSVLATGEINLASTGSYSFSVNSDDGALMWIDDTLVVNAWSVGSPGIPRTGTFNNPSTGWHRIRLQTRELTGYKQMTLGYTPPGGSYAIVPASNLRPRYDLVTKETTDDTTSGSPSSVVATNYGTVGGATDPAYGLTLSTTENPGGLNLTTSSGFESPRTADKYLRPTSRTLPAGNSTTYAYYGKTEIVTNPCTGLPSIPQAGLMKTRTSPTPASGNAIVENFVYDIWGQVIASWRNGDQPTCIAFDNRGRPRTMDVPAYGGYPARTVTTSYSVANDTSVSAISDPVGTITTKVDMLGRPTTYTDVWGNVTTSSYDQAGRPTDTAMPGDIRRLEYDSLGRVSAQKQGPSALALETVALPTYNPATSEMTRIDYPSGVGNGGNGTWVTIGRDSLRRTNSLTYSNSGGAITSDSVTYSQAGRVVDQSIDGVDAYASGNNFAYDAAGRLTTARVLGHTYNYAFAASSGCPVNAAAGKNTNRTSFTDNGGTAITYCYDNADRLTSTTDPRYSSINYDSHGNTTTLGTQSMGYDLADRHMTTNDGSSTVTYVRDALDRIVSRTVGGVTTRYAYATSSDSPSAVTDSANVVLDKVVELLGGASKSVRGVTPTWNYPNIHGDVAAQAAVTGAKQGSTFTYDPFGQQLAGLPDTRSGNFDDAWLGTQRRATEHEGSSSIVEMGSRQYAPGLGRFLEVDLIEGGSANDYDYANGDPVNGRDLDGTCSGARQCARMALASSAGVAFMRVAEQFATAVVCSLVGAGRAICGGIVGAILSAARSALTQWAKTGSVNWSEVLWQGVAGGVTGAGLGKLLGGKSGDALRKGTIQVANQLKRLLS